MHGPDFRMITVMPAFCGRRKIYYILQNGNFRPQDRLRYTWWTVEQQQHYLSIVLQVATPLPFGDDMRCKSTLKCLSRQLREVRAITEPTVPGVAMYSS